MNAYDSSVLVLQRQLQGSKVANAHIVVIVEVKIDNVLAREETPDLQLKVRRP